jgi:hypothetical protein
MRIKPWGSRLLLPLVLSAAAAPGQRDVRATTAIRVPVGPIKVPFEVGERLTYGVKLSAFNAGSTTMSVDSIVRVRGMPTYHTEFDLKGHILFKHFDNHCESWIDTSKFVSLHQVQTLNGTTKTYDFYGDRKVYVRADTTFPSVAEPLDECAFLYFLRTIPLEVGKTYTFDRYYHAEKNPIVVTVEKRQRITVAAGTFDAVLVHPVIKSNGMFSEAGQADVWIATEGTRPILSLKTKLSLGTLNLELNDISPKP